jgi:hypothetical protein
MNKKIRLGLTATFANEYQDTWGSGITQNIYFLYRLFEKAEQIGEVVIVDLTLNDAQEKFVTFAGHTCRAIDQHQAMETLDVVIEIGTILWPNIAEAVQARGGKVVSMRCGNAYMDEIMSIFNDQPSIVPNSGIHYDEIWVLPHHAPGSAPMLRTQYRCPVRVVPYVWDPIFIDRVVEANPTAYPFGWQKGKASRNLAICEPNLNPLKTFHIPLLACEEVYRAQPEKLGHVYNLNSYKLNSSPSFLQFVHRLDITRLGIVSYESRIDIVTLLTQHADIVVSHQWNNALNNLYFDVLHGGYPLVHNSEFFCDYGYYYDGFDCQTAAQQILRAIHTHDEQLDEYRAKTNAFLARYAMFHPANISAYEQLVCQLFDANETTEVLL